MQKYTLEYHKPGKVSTNNKIHLRTFHAVDDNEAIRMARALSPEGFTYDGNNWRLWLNDTLIAD